MALIVKDFTWSQTDKMVNIKVPLKAVSHEKVDLFTTDSYIKAHFKPFLFEIFPLHNIDSRKSKCFIKDDVIIFDLLKREEIEWECLEKNLSKSEKMDIKLKVIEKCQEEAKQAFEHKRIKKSQLDRFTVQKAMEIDSAHHNTMDSRRDSERNKAMNELEEWRKSNDMEKGVKIIELTDNSEKLEKKLDNNKTVEKVKIVQQPQKIVKKIVKSEYIDKKKAEVATKIVPKLRETFQLDVSHTRRTFPTPSRESQAQEEEQWLKNVTLARRATGESFVIINHHGRFLVPKTKLVSGY